MLLIILEMAVQLGFSQGELYPRALDYFLNQLILNGDLSVLKSFLNPMLWLFLFFMTGRRVDYFNLQVVYTLFLELDC